MTSISPAYHFNYSNVSNYELIQTTQNSSFQEKEILYIFAPDGLFAINETLINHCKFDSPAGEVNCKFVAMQRL